MKWTIEKATRALNSHSKKLYLDEAFDLVCWASCRYEQEKKAQLRHKYKALVNRALEAMGCK